MLSDLQTERSKGHEYHSRWWQLKYFDFHPECLGKWNPIWLAHIFQMGWKKTPTGYSYFTINKVWEFLTLDWNCFCYTYFPVKDVFVIPTLALVETGIFVPNKLLRLNNLASSPWKHRGSLQCQIVRSPGLGLGECLLSKWGPNTRKIPWDSNHHH